MTPQEFQAPMDRLISQFGKSAYSPARIELIAAEVKHMPGSWWKRTVDRFLGEFRQAPLMPEVREAIAKERERGWDAQKVIPLNAWQEPRNARCGYCRDLGYLLAFDKSAEVKAPYAFKCNCEIGRRSRHAFPEWEQSDQFKWEIR
jgi:hypothetical protein